MTIEEARRIRDEFDTENVTEDDFFIFTEAMAYLIENCKDPRDMMYLGGYYYAMRKFDLALKYYEMAAELDSDEAYEYLGYVWYYGRTGTKDYEKAFYYFSKMMEKGNPVATYKVADMYKNGYYVDKDQSTYERMIEELYPKVKNCRDLFDPLPEVFTRLAAIYTSRGKTKKAINLYYKAKDFLAQRIIYNPFFGNLNIMKWLVNDLYKLVQFDTEDMDLYDLYYFLKEPHVVRFEIKGKEYEVESVLEGKECNIRFGNKWYRSIDDFMGDAETDEGKLTSLYFELENFEVIR